MNAARRLFFPLVWAALLVPPVFGQQLPVKGSAGDLQKEAAQLIDGLPSLTEPPVAAGTPERTLTVEQAEKRLAEAKRKQERWTKLAKTGVLSKAEAEGCAVEVAQAAVRCAKVHLAEAQENFDRAEKESAGEAAAALENAKAAMEQATADFNQTRLQVAQTSLQRFRVLYAEHLVTKPQLQVMEARVAKFQGDGGAPAAAPSK